jgi:hypothetical protein
MENNKNENGKRWPKAKNLIITMTVRELIIQLLKWLLE